MFPLWSQIRNPRITDITSQHSPAFETKITIFKSNAIIRFVESDRQLYENSIYSYGARFSLRSQIYNPRARTSVQSAACFLCATKLRSLNT